MPITCQDCGKNPATVNFIDTVNGETVAVHLCEKCYAKKYGEFENTVMNALFNGLFDNPRRKGQKVCSLCGMSFEDYEKTGLMGCPSCYDVFKDEILPYIARIQGKTKHVGKEGGDHSSEHDLRIRLKALQDQLEAALTRGDFHAADRLNRQMTAIKRRIMGGGAND